MADNYLEKKYEELQHGRPVVRRSTPSLDTLVRRAADQRAGDAAYVVKQAQLDAMVRTAGMLGADVSFAADESTASIEASCASPRNMVALGEALLAIRLKAAELSLSTSEELAPDGLSAVVKVFR